MEIGLGPARKRILRQRNRMLFGFVISPRASWQLAVCGWLGARWRSRAETKSMYNKFRGHGAPAGGSPPGRHNRAG
jgi:hypothetical protein